MIVLLWTSKHLWMVLLFHARTSFCIVHSKIKCQMQKMPCELINEFYKILCMKIQATSHLLLFFLYFSKGSVILVWNGSETTWFKKMRVTRFFLHFYLNIFNNRSYRNCRSLQRCVKKKSKINLRERLAWF